MRHAVFSQRYREGDRYVTCSWGISGDSMSFLIIDATGETRPDVKLQMTTDGDDSHGILGCARGIHCIDVVGMVVYVTEDCVGGMALPMSANQLTSYLGSGKYPLSLSGVRSFLHDCDADEHLSSQSRQQQYS